MRALVLAALLLVFLALPANAVTRDVCKPGGGCTYTTIQAALNAAQPGDVVNVEDATERIYAESLTIGASQNHGIALDCKGTTSVLKVIRPSSGNALTLSGKENLTIRNCIFNTTATISATNVNHSRLENLQPAATSPQSPCLSWSTGTNNTIYRAQFDSCGHALSSFHEGNVSNSNFTGLYALTLTDSRNNTLDGNRITGGRRGLILSGTTTNNTFTNNAFTVNSLGLWFNTNDDPVIQLTVSGTAVNNSIDATNTLNGRPIIYRHAGNVNPALDCPSGAEETFTTPSLVFLANCQNYTVKDSLVRDGEGLVLQGTTNVTIQNSTFSENTHGIKFTTGNLNTTIAYNNFTRTQNTQMAIFSAASEFGSTVSAAAAATFNVTGNQWVAPDGPRPIAFYAKDSFFPDNNCPTAPTTFTLSNYSTAIFLHCTDSTLDASTLDQGDGILAWGTTRFTLQNSRVSNATFAIYARSGANTSVLHNVFHNTTFSTGLGGMWDGVTMRQAYDLIYNNTLSHTELTLTGAFQNATNNTMTGTASSLLLCQETSNATIHMNEVVNILCWDNARDNNITSNSVSDFIQIGRESQRNRVVNNLAKRIILGQAGFGIAQYNQLDRNTLSPDDGQRGIDFAGAGPDFTIAAFQSNITTTNTVDGKPVYYYVDYPTQGHGGAFDSFAACPNNTIVNGLDSGHVELVGCDNATISNAVVRGDGVRFDFTNNSAVRDSAVNGSHTTGVVFFSSSHNAIRNATVTQNYQSGIQASSINIFFPTLVSHNVTVDNSTLDQNGRILSGNINEISITGGDNHTISNSNITRRAFSDAGIGIRFSGTIRSASIVNNTIQETTLGGGDHVALNGPTEFLLVQNNTFTHARSPLRLGTTTLDHARVINNRFSTAAGAVGSRLHVIEFATFQTARSQNLTIANNTMTSSGSTLGGIGVKFFDAVTVDGNTITVVARPGLEAANTTNVTARNNRVVGGTQAFLLANVSTASLDNDTAYNFSTAGVQATMYQNWTANLTIRDSNFTTVLTTTALYGLLFENVSNNAIYNTTVSVPSGATRYSVYLNSSHNNYFLNTTFNKTAVFVSSTAFGRNESNLTVDWYLRANVTSENTGAPVSGANVTVTLNETGGFVFSALTDATGLIAYGVAREYEQNSSQVYPLSVNFTTPHNVTATKNPSNSTSLNVTESTTVGLTLPVDQCSIGGVFYDDGETNPNNSCQECNFLADPNDWTNDDTNLCGDGVCSYCSAGACIDRTFGEQFGACSGSFYCDGAGTCISTGLGLNCPAFATAASTLIQATLLVNGVRTCDEPNVLLRVVDGGDNTYAPASCANGVHDFAIDTSANANYTLTAYSTNASYSVQNATCAFPRVLVTATNVPDLHPALALLVLLAAAFALAAKQRVAHGF